MASFGFNYLRFVESSKRTVTLSAQNNSFLIELLFLALTKFDWHEYLFLNFTYDMIQLVSLKTS